MVPCIRHQNLILAVASHVPRIHELSIARALLAELEQELSVHREDLHPVVVLVRHDESAHVVQTHAGRSVKLAWPGALRTKLVLERSVPAKEKLDLEISPPASQLTDLLKMQILLLLLSATTISPDGVQQIPQGRQSWPSPVPSLLNSSTGTPTFW